MNLPADFRCRLPDGMENTDFDTCKICRKYIIIDAQPKDTSLMVSPGYGSIHCRTFEKSRNYGGNEEYLSENWILEGTCRTF